MEVEAVGHPLISGTYEVSMGKLSHSKSFKPFSTLNYRSKHCNFVHL